MKITEVYKKYKITKSLQEHHLRVAAVAKQICDDLTVPVDAKTIIEACLLHDMGNIIKFDLDKNPKWLEPEGKDYWKTVQTEFKKKYGDNEHQASIEIAKELGASQDVLKCIGAIGFNKAVQNSKSNDLEAKLCDYADTRVSPHGVVRILERLTEGQQRYKDRSDKWILPGMWEELSSACYKIEEQVFANSRIKPSDITDESVAPIIEQLKTYEITETR